MEEKNTQQGQEKRREERVKIYLKKTFKCEFYLPDMVKNCFAHIENISLSGMQIHLDFPIPTNVEIPITIQGQEPLELKIKKMWQKQLMGGMYITGVEFEQLTEDSRKKIADFIEKFSGKGKRKAYRLHKVLAVELQAGETLKKFYGLTHDLSEKGMGLMYDEGLPLGSTINLKLLLKLEDEPVELAGKVMWSKKTSFDHYLIGMEFIDIKPETIKRIDAFIDRCFDEEEKEKAEKDKNPVNYLK